MPIKNKEKKSQDAVPLSGITSLRWCVQGLCLRRSGDGGDDDDGDDGGDLALVLVVVLDFVAVVIFRLSFGLCVFGFCYS